VKPAAPLPLVRLAVLLAVLLAPTLSSCGPDAPEPRPTTAPPVAQPKTLVLDIEKLKRGAEPAIAWASGTLLNGDRSMDVLPAGLDQFARSEQLLVMRDVDGRVFAYAPEGPTSTTPIGEATGDLAINTERNMVAWIEPDGSPTVLQEGHAKPVTLPAPEGEIDGADAVAVLGRDCFNGPETVEGAGCSVWFGVHGKTARSFIASNHGFVDEAENQIRGLQDADRDGSVGWTKLNPDSSTCSRYAAARSAQQNWRTCDHLPLEFSPDGGHLLATGPHGIEGLGTGELSILDRDTGTATLTVTTLDDDAAFITDMTWEDAGHVLAIVFQKGEWAVIRIGQDGAMDIAVAPIEGEETESPFTLSVQP
jgi:hypothetical protein